MIVAYRDKIGLKLCFVFQDDDKLAVVFGHSGFLGEFPFLLPVFRYLFFEFVFSFPELRFVEIILGGFAPVFPMQSNFLRGL
jgi:hypothetical protein